MDCAIQNLFIKLIYLKTGLPFVFRTGIVEFTDILAQRNRNRHKSDSVSTNRPSDFILGPFTIDGNRNFPKHKPLVPRALISNRSTNQTTLWIGFGIFC